MVEEKLSNVSEEFFESAMDVERGRAKINRKRFYEDHLLGRSGKEKGSITSHKNLENKMKQDDVDKYPQRILIFKSLSKQKSSNSLCGRDNTSRKNTVESMAKRSCIDNVDYNTGNFDRENKLKYKFFCTPEVTSKVSKTNKSEVDDDTVHSCQKARSLKLRPKLCSASDLLLREAVEYFTGSETDSDDEENDKNKNNTGNVEILTVENKVTELLCEKRLIKDRRNKFLEEEKTRQKIATLKEALKAKKSQLKIKR
eukprot:Awhi_evm1s15240